MTKEAHLLKRKYLGESVRVTRYLFGVVSCCLVTVQCTESNSPIGPPESLRPRNVSAPLTSNVESNIPAGPTSIGGGFGLTSTGVTVQPWTYARVVARGKPTATMDPNCPPGQNAFDILSPIPPDGADTNRSGAISMNLEGDAAFTDWNHKGDTVYFTYRDVEEGQPARDLYVDRKGFSYSCVIGLGEAFPKYTISGSTTLTIDLLGVEVNASALTIFQGQSVTATASSINFQNGSIVWSYDTAQYKPQIALASCSNTLVCSYAPSRSGRFIACMVDSFSGFFSVCGPSSNISVGPPLTLDLVCSGGTPRGANLDCTVSPGDPSQTIAVQAWSFTSGSGVRFDRRTDVTSRTWSGALVTDGVVRVEATVSGSLLSDSVQVVTSARSWTGKISLKDHSVIPTTLSAKPDSFADLGRTTHSLPADTNTNRWLKLVNDEGPNQDFTYLIDLPPITTTAAQVNTNAINGTSPFYQVQEAKRKKIGNLWFCPKSTVTSVLFDLSQKHEGAVANPDVYPNSHPGIFRAYVDANAFSRFEPVIGTVFTAPHVGIMQNLFNDALADSKAMDSDSRNYITYATLGNCTEFHFTYP